MYFYFFCTFIFTLHLFCLFCHWYLGTKQYCCRTRIYFLGTPSNGWETTLLYVDIGHFDHVNGPRLHWLPVIEANFQRYAKVMLI